MKITHVLSVAAVAVLGLTALPPMVSAQEAPATRPARPMMERGRGIQEVLKDLNLTDDQKAKIKTIMETHRTKMEEFRTAHKDEFEKLRADMQAAREAKDREKMREAGEKMRALMEQGPKPGALVDDIKAVLTPEQRETFTKKMEELRTERGPGGPGGPGGRRGPGGPGTRPADGK